MNRHITLRPARPDDDSFMFGVFASTREDLLHFPGWDDQRRHALIAMQFKAQSQDYRGRFPNSGYQVILVDGSPAGRLFVDRGDDELRLVDIALLPEYRGRGIGGALLEILVAEAARAGKPVRLHVEPLNPAVRLYRRLGFETIDPAGFPLEMERFPAPAGGADMTSTAPA